MNKTVTEICVNIIPEQATSTSAAEKCLERCPIGQIHSEQQTGCCGATRGGKSERPFQMFESQFNLLSKLQEACGGLADKTDDVPNNALEVVHTSKVC